MTVTPYNFQKPGRLNLALEQQVQSWLGSACALATRRWVKDLPAPFELTLSEIETLRSRPAFLALPEDTIAYRVLLHDHLATVIAWPRGLVLGIIGTLLGDALVELPENRELTAVDESLFEFFLRDLLLPSFVECWTGTIALRPAVGDKVLHPRWAKIYPPDETLLVSNFVIKGTFGTHPWRWLQPLGELQSAARDDADAGGDKANLAERLEANVRDLPVELSVNLGKADLPLAQLSQLQIGDVILLDQAVNQPLTARIEGADKIVGWPGKLGSRQAFRIEQWKE